MADPITNAVAAYSNAGKIAATPGLTSRDGAQDGGFADLLRKAAENSVETLKQGEQASLNGVMGKADIAQVAAAVANARRSICFVHIVIFQVVTADNRASFAT